MGNETDVRKKNIQGFETLNKSDVKEHLDDILASNHPLYRLKKDGTRVIIPAEKLDQFIGDHTDANMTFYMEDNWRNFIVKKSEITGDKKSTASDLMESIEESEYEEELKDENFSKRLKEVEELSISERQKLIQNNLYKLEKLRTNNKKFSIDTIIETVNIFSETICINKTTLEENVDSPIDTADLKDLVTKTHLLVNSLISMLEKGKTTYKELAQLQHVDTGSNTLDHMNRILLRFIAFLFYYNNYFNTNKIKKLRPEFEIKYFSYYNKIVQGRQKINLEIIFKGGIRPIENKGKFLEYCVGALIHDLGKVPNIVYHDSSEVFDINNVRKHVFESYNMIIKSKTFTLGEASMGLLHHDYYGAPYGYNQIETLRKKMKHKIKRLKVEVPVKHFITYDIEDILDGTTFSYFPNKIMELLDVFDSLTDTEKKYRPVQNNAVAAITIMRNEFIEGSHLGLDPVLFNIFVDFLHESGILVDPDDIELLQI